MAVIVFSDQAPSFVSLQKATFSCSIRDVMVLRILEKVQKGHPEDLLVKRLSCFAAEVLILTSVIWVLRVLVPSCISARQQIVTVSH